MPSEPTGYPDPERCRGFALVIVLWALVLIAFIVLHVSTTGRIELQIATNFSANAAAAAAADGAIYQAIFSLSDPRPDYRWAPDATVHELRIGESRITLRIEDEAGRINPSFASAGLLEGLLRAVGTDPGRAAELVVEITEWVGSTRSPRNPGELSAEYRAAGLNYAAPEAPLESIDELGRVRGMDSRLLDALRPHLTLFGPAEPNPARADPVVVAAIAFAARNAAGVRQPATNSTPGPLTVRIHATVRGPGNAEATRSAIVRVGSFTAEKYSLLSWEDTDQ